MHTRDDLADLAVDELTEITGQSADDAKALILKAREHWFAEPTTLTVMEQHRTTKQGCHNGVTTVAEFAERAQEDSPKPCLSSSSRAGVAKAAADDALTEADKQRLLGYLKASARHRRAPSARRSR